MSDVYTALQSQTDLIHDQEARISELEAALERERAANAVLREAAEEVVDRIGMCLQFPADDARSWFGTTDDQAAWRKLMDVVVSDNPGAGVMGVVRAVKDTIRRMAEIDEHERITGYIVPVKEWARVESALAALNGDRDA